MYPRVYTMLGLALGCAAVTAGPAWAQRPDRLAPSPKVNVEAPARPAPVAPRLTREDVEAWLDGYMP